MEKSFGRKFISLLALLLFPNKDLRFKLKRELTPLMNDPLRSPIFYLRRFLKIYPSSKNNKKVVYTVITGGYDNLIHPLYFDKNWDYICYTDSEKLIKKGDKFWKILPIPRNISNIDLNEAKKSRYPKIIAHKFLNQYEYSLYIDANIDIISYELFDKANDLISKEVKLAITDHPRTNCTYKEFETCLKFDLDKYENMIEQIKLFEKEGFPYEYGLKENNIILRKHNDSDIIKLMEDWWFWVENYSKRDQLSLMFVLWKNNYPKVQNILNTPARFSKDDLFFYKHHKAKDKKIL